MLVKIVHTADAVQNMITNDTSVHRVELRNSKGEIKFFKLRACNRSDARTEASEIARTLATVEKNTILWRMTNDTQWSIASECQERIVKRSRVISKIKAMKEKIDDFFWVPEELEGGRS